jgi:hypothetical protein
MEILHPLEILMTAAMLCDMIKEILCISVFVTQSEKVIHEVGPYHSFSSFAWFTGFSAFIQMGSIYY